MEGPRPPCGTSTPALHPPACERWAPASGRGAQGQQPEQTRQRGSARVSFWRKRVCKRLCFGSSSPFRLGRSCRLGRLLPRTGEGRGRRAAPALESHAPPHVPVPAHPTLSLPLPRRPGQPRLALWLWGPPVVAPRRSPPSLSLWKRLRARNAPRIFLLFLLPSSSCPGFALRRLR